MKKKSTILKVGLVGVAAAILPIIGAGQAFADYAPQSNDFVGVGGDTPQFAVDFALNGDPVSGNPGYDASATVNRVVSFLATPDYNGRSAYTNNATTGANSTALLPTDVLRAGQFPVERISSSGNSLTALLADTGSPENINFITSTTPPTSAQQSAATGLGWGYLHVVQFATDSVAIAVNNGAAGTNAPVSGLSIADLVGIYSGTITKWNQIPGNSGGSSDTIVPYDPASSSAIYKALDAALKTANSNTAITYSSAVKTVEQNDPSVINNNPDALVPISASRVNTYANGYFHSPTNTNGTLGAVLSSGVKLFTATGTPADGGAAADWTSPVTDYVIFRQSDVATAAPIAPGSTLTWIQALFSDPATVSNPTPVPPYFDKTTAKNLIQAAGVTWSYNDLGNFSVG